MRGRKGEALPQERGDQLQPGSGPRDAEEGSLTGKASGRGELFKWRKAGARRL